MRLVIISGRSGSGKTIALQALEDLGFYCIDNLPLSFLSQLESQVGELHPQVAVSIDVRNSPSDSSEYQKLINDLQKAKQHCEIVYLDAEENALLKRFSETRRKHPLTSPTTSLREAIRKEHDILAPIASLADLMINTSPLSRQALYNLIRERIVHYQGSKIQLLLQSFGFKHGLPPEADFIFDIRCLPNPYWQAELRPFNGLDKPVKDYLENISDMQAMLNDISQFIMRWIPRFEADNRSYITIAIGCTGGQHRSVYMTEKLLETLSHHLNNIQVRHRELKIGE